MPWLDGLTALAQDGRPVGRDEADDDRRAGDVARADAVGQGAVDALDIVSGGRVIAGLGPGSSKADYEAMGVPFEQRWQRFDTAVRLVKGMLQPGPGWCRADREAVAAAMAKPRDPAVDRKLGLAGGLAPGGLSG